MERIQIQLKQIQAHNPQIFQEAPQIGGITMYHSLKKYGFHFKLEYY